MGERRSAGAVGGRRNGTRRDAVADEQPNSAVRAIAIVPTL
jgi:hypothetical protein